MKREYPITVKISNNPTPIYRSELLSKLHEMVILQQIEQLSQEQQKEIVAKIINMR